MRTKVLLGLAALAVGLSTSVAQNVYSLNVVGYVNVTLHAGQSHFLSLPLAPVDGNFNITNTIALGVDEQDGANIYTWNVALGKWDNSVPTWIGPGLGGTGWDTPTVISNGIGFFLVAANTTSTLTFVGQVPQGTGASALQYNIPVGVSTLANQVPNAAPFPGSTIGNFGDNIYTWNQGLQKWDNAVWLFVPPADGGSGWDNGLGTDPSNNTNGPAISPGAAVFYVNGGAAIPFTQNFTVN